MKTFTLYPEYALGDLSRKSTRQNKQMQEHNLNLLRQAIAQGDTPKVNPKHFVLLPTEDAHTGHPTGSSRGFAQRIHLLLAQKIYASFAAAKQTLVRYECLCDSMQTIRLYTSQSNVIEHSILLLLAYRSCVQR